MQLAFSLDPGSAPSVLAALADADIAQRVVNVAAESYTEDALDWIGSGKAFKSHSGELEQSIGWTPGGDGVAEVYANADYARYVEHGTGEHAGHTSWVIRPTGDRKALKINVPGGGYVLRRAVTHHGSKPHPFFFADQDNRLENMRVAGRSVLAEALANG